MWLLLSRRLRRFVLLTVLVPLLPKAFRWARVQVERRTGPTRATRSLGHAEALTQRLVGRSTGGSAR